MEINETYTSIQFFKPFEEESYQAYYACKEYLEALCPQSSSPSKQISDKAQTEEYFARSRAIFMESFLERQLR